MLTKYILHGGATSKNSIHNDEFFAQFTDLGKDKVNILLCYWAMEKEKWNKLFKRDKQKIIKHSKVKNLNIEQVLDGNDFDRKIEKVDVFYLAGGEADLLKERILKINNFKQKIKGKVVIGSSAGAFLLCKYSVNSFDGQDQELKEGLRLLPFSVLAHFDIEEKKQEKMKVLKNKAPNLPIITLDECKFSVFYN